MITVRRRAPVSQDPAQAAVLDLILHYRLGDKRDAVSFLRGLDAGQPIHFEPQKEGRFKPLSKENWTKELYVAPIDFGGGAPGSQPDMRGH